MQARYYDPRPARFISEDTYEGEIDQPQSLNLYTYAQNNPLYYVDPSGHMTWKAWWYVNRGEQDEFVSQGWNSVKAIFQKQTYQVIRAISRGEISIRDIAEAFGNDLARAIKYQADHYKHINYGKPTKDEAYSYGRALGKVECGLLTLSTAGTGVARLTMTFAKKLKSAAPTLLTSLKFKAKVSELVKNPADPFDYNRGNYSAEALRNARNYIQRHGTISSPILIKILDDGRMMIEDGHHRWWAAKQMGLTEVPVKVVK